VSKKHFSSLLVLTAVVVIAIYLMPGKTGNEASFEVQPLFAGMDQWVNDVERMHVTAAGNQVVVTLLKSDQAWVVENAGSYAANWNRLKTLLASLTQARVIEPKTSNEKYFDRLGLVDVSDEASEAVLVEVNAGKESIRLLIGKSAQDREGQYVRLPEGERALLIDQTLDAAGEIGDWLQRDIIDLSEAEIVELTITHPDGEQVRLKKTSAEEQDFTLLGLPEGREILSSWTVNSLAGTLSALQLDQVRKEDSMDWSQAVELSFLTADGLVISASQTKVDETTWLRVHASTHVAKAGLEQQSESEQSSGLSEAAATDELEKRVTEINARVSGWAYAVPENNSQNMSKRMEDLLKPIAEV
jgi:hypothetical protein